MMERMMTMMVLAEDVRDGDDGGDDVAFRH